MNLKRRKVIPGDTRALLSIDKFYSETELQPKQTLKGNN